MGLNLVKLCVGISAVEKLKAWIDYRLAQQRERGVLPEYYHTTRMIPRRGPELLDGGSLYWVIKGKIQCRQRLLEIRKFTDDKGIERCRLMLDRDLIATEWHPRRAFQGWRYLKMEEAPRDLGVGSELAGLPPELRRELADLGLL